MAKRGRKTLYTPERVKVIIEAIQLGGSDVDACEHGGIKQQTFYRWLNEKSEFREQVTRTRIVGKLLRIGRIKQHGEKDWRADAWYLERRWPEEYANSFIIKLSDEDRALLKQLGFPTPAAAWQALMDNARKEYADAQSDS